MTLATFEMPTLKHREIPVRLTVTQYHAMIKEEILAEGEPIELLNGRLVRKDRSALGEDPMTVGTAHATVLDRILDLNPKFKKLGCYIRIQQPVTLPPFSEPEPDAAIGVGAIGDYSRRHPHAKDILCVIEVADSSLNKDRTRKLRIYAKSNLPVYIIINLVDQIVEIYTEPMAAKGRYHRVNTLQRNENLELPAAGGKVLRVPVRKILP
jgi:Uma2 family endonuclease